MDEFAAVVLAGGHARRMGGTDKPALPVDGESMLWRVLAAVADADPRVVVGPRPADLPGSVRHTRESPPGGGPVAATAAGLARVDAGTPVVGLFAADLPLLTGPAVDLLRRALAERAADVAVYRDTDGRRQVLCGVWRAAALRAALGRVAAERGGVAGAPVRALLDGRTVADVSWQRPGPPPWFDVDTPHDLHAAQEWARGIR